MYVIIRDSTNQSEPEQYTVSEPESDGKCKTSSEQCWVVSERETGAVEMIYNR